MKLTTKFNFNNLCLRTSLLMMMYLYRNFQCLYSDINVQFNKLELSVNIQQIHFLTYLGCLQHVYSFRD